MDNLTELAERLLSWLLLPATLYGAAGAFVRARRMSQPLRKTLIELISGVMMTNAMSPAIESYLTASWHSTAYFLVGFGGVLLAERLYDVAAEALEKRLQKKLDGE